MGMVTDRLLEELRAEYDQMHNTWIPPEVHATTVHDLDAATAALKNLEVSHTERREKQQHLFEASCLVQFDPSLKTFAAS